MEEAPENGKESSNSAHANGMKWMIEHLVNTGFKSFFIALHSQELQCNGCCLSSNCECSGASPCGTEIVLGKASCFVFYMHWRNYILCGCNISPSSQMVNKLFLFLRAIFILRPHYVQWMVTTCLSFVYTPTDMGLVLQWSKWNFIKENMFMFMKPNTTLKML